MFHIENFQIYKKKMMLNSKVKLFHGGARTHKIFKHSVVFFIRTKDYKNLIGTFIWRKCLIFGVSYNSKEFKNKIFSRFFLIISKRKKS